MPTKKKTKKKKPTPKAKQKGKASPKPKAKAKPQKVVRAKARVTKEKSALPRLRMLIAAHPGLVLREPERSTFAAEARDLDAVARASSDVELLTHCVFALRKMAQFERALAIADRALAIERTFATLTAKATVHRAASEPDAAIALFDEAARLDATDLSALMEGGRTLGEVGRFGDAATWFHRAFERDTTDMAALVWREYSAYCHDKKREHVAAIEKVANEGLDDGLASELLESIANES